MMRLRFGVRPSDWRRLHIPMITPLRPYCTPGPRALTSVVHEKNLVLRDVEDKTTHLPHNQHDLEVLHATHSKADASHGMDSNLKKSPSEVMPRLHNSDDTAQNVVKQYRVSPYISDEPRTEMELSDPYLTNESLHGLERIPTLRKLSLRDKDEPYVYHNVSDVSCLASSTSITELDLSGTHVTDEGIRGLERIPTLQKVNLSDCKRITDVSCLATSTSITELNLSRTKITVEGIRGVACIPTLQKFSLSHCDNLSDVRSLAASTSLVEIDLSMRYDAKFLGGISGLERIPTLQKLNLDYCMTLKDLRCLKSSKSLTELSLYQVPVTNKGLHTLSRIPTLRRLRVASKYITDIQCLIPPPRPEFWWLVVGGYVHAPHIAKLERLDLSGCVNLSNVDCLASSITLREINLSRTRVTDEGLRVLARIPTLTKLELRYCRDPLDVTYLSDLASPDAACSSPLMNQEGGLQSQPLVSQPKTLHLTHMSDARQVTDVASLPSPKALLELDFSDCKLTVEGIRGLAASTSLEELHLSGSGVTNDGIRGLEELSTLYTVSLDQCPGITDVRCLASSTSLTELDISHTMVTSEGLRGLERIPKLWTLTVNCCSHLRDLRCLAASKSLVQISASRSSMVNKGILGLERISTLQKVLLSFCNGISDVRCFARSKSLVSLDLRESRVKDVRRLKCSTSLKAIDLSHCPVTNEGVVGLECIPTLETLNLCGCSEITDLRPLRSSRSLTRLNVVCTKLSHNGVRALYSIPTLKELRHFTYSNGG